MDLNLLRAFVAIYEARSLTGAASLLFITQPAVSQSLSRLRREMSDDLFFRDGREMTPTPFAEELYPTIRESLDRIQDAVATRGFDPSASQRRFRIALSELGEIHWLAPIAGTLRAVAPGVSLDVQPLDHLRAADQLSRGALDLAISSAPVHGDFDTHTLKVEHYVVLLSARHPLATGRLDFDAYRAAEHVTVAGDSGRPNVENALRELGGAPEPRVRVNHFAALPTLLETSGLVATAPRSLAEVWSRSRQLVFRPLPFHVAPVEVRLYARSAHSDAPALRWFRDTVLSAVLDSRDEASPVPLIG